MLARFSHLWLSLSLLGCASQTAAEHRVWMPTYLFGSIGGGDLDVRDVCTSGRASELSLGSSFGTLSVSVVTLGIYTPREAKVRCAPAAR